MSPLNKPVEKRFYTITEVAEELSLNASVLRYWEKEFRQLNPRTNARGKRFYTRKDIELITKIQELVRGKGFTIDGARRVLSGEVEVEQQKQEVPSNLHVIQRLQALKKRVMEIPVEPDGVTLPNVGSPTSSS
jgi:DNA-binding transcriptional MerR regulator